MVEVPMIAEVVIHLGSEWRDLLMCMIGMVAGGFLGFLYGWDYGAKPKKKQ
jgi:hypothetical protein